MNFHPQRFLYYLLAGTLAWQAALFSYGVWACSKLSPITQLTSVCPDLGDRYEMFVSTSLGAILGLIGGSAAMGAAASRPKKQIDVRDDRRNPQDPDGKP